MVKKAIDLLVEKQKLENQYGWQSCFDVPEQYQRMDELAEQARELIEQIARKNGLYYENLYEVADTIAYEIANGNIQENAEIDLYTQDEYIDVYITDGMDEQTKEVFDSLFYYMNSDDRAGWIKANYTDHDPNAWTDRFVTFVLMVRD